MTDKSQINQTILHENLDDFIVYNRQNAATLQVYNKDFEKKIKQELAKNSVAQNIIKNIVNNTNFEIQNKILIFQDLIYVLTRCEQEVINIYYSLRVHEHQKFDKIIEKIFRIYYFLKLRKQIENIIIKCNVYVKVKHSQYKSYKLLKSLNISNRA